MQNDIQTLLSEDAALIREGLATFSDYDFSADLIQRMEQLPISSLALGTRCYVSHTIVDKWRQGKARPNGKERMKELGMALGMDEAELNTFLYQNGYPRLYAKNPLDSVAKIVLMQAVDREDIVTGYRSMIERLNLADYAPRPDLKPLLTRTMSAELRRAAEEGQISGWFRAHQENFTGSAKTQLPDLQSVRFLLLYIGESNIHEMSVTGDLPSALSGLLYLIANRRAVNVHRLRAKLVSFGLYSNMTEEELDVLLGNLRLRPISDPATKVDFAILSALRCAHERYPYYEANNLSRIVARLSNSGNAYDRALLPDFSLRLKNAETQTAYYDRHANDSECSLFERNYTAYSDRGVMDYVHDILQLLVRQGAISPVQAKPMLFFLGRTQEGEPEWN